MICSNCEKDAIIREKELVDYNFRGEKYSIYDFFYKCTNCNHEYTTIELDNLTINQVYNAYREKHLIPFPEEIKRNREKFGLSAKRMGEILGLGQNTYSNYENGEMPSLSNANLLRLPTISPQAFIQLVIDKRSSSNWITDKIVNKIQTVIENERKDNIKDAWHIFLLGEIRPKSINGYRKPDLLKFSKMIGYFADKQHPFKTKLNKLLFYSDFYHYSKYGESISGMTYSAIDYGPVPDNFASIYDFLRKSGQVNIEIWSENDSEFWKFKSSTYKIQEIEFSPKEMETLNEVNNAFKKYSAGKLKQISHEEKAWKENQDMKGLIDYQKYAFELEFKNYLKVG